MERKSIEAREKNKKPRDKKTTAGMHAHARVQLARLIIMRMQNPELCRSLITGRCWRTR